MAWKSSHSFKGEDEDGKECILHSQYTDDDNQILEQIDFYRMSKGCISIIALWHRAISKEKQIEIWKFLADWGLGARRADYESLGPALWLPTNFEQQNKFLAIIFTLGKFDLQTKTDICAEFKCPFNKIEAMSLAVFADPVNEILEVDSESVSIFSDSYRASPVFFHESLSRSFSIEASESSDSEEELASDREEELSNSTSWLNQYRMGN